MYCHNFHVVLSDGDFFFARSSISCPWVISHTMTMSPNPISLFTVTCFTSLWTSISVFYINTACDIVTGLLIFAEYLSLTYTFSHAHTEAHTEVLTHKHTCIISTQQEWRQPGTGNLVEKGGRKAFVRDLAHTKK